MTKAGFYAVAVGRIPGVYASWGECDDQINGFSGAKYKKFKTRREAERFVGFPSSSLSSPVAQRSRIAGDPYPVAQRMKEARELKHEATIKPIISIEERAEEEGYDVVYCDGACKGNGQKGSVAGIGVWWGNNNPRNIAERCPGTQTNNRAELIAIVRVLEETPAYGRPLMIKTDSNYSIKCLRDWHQSWILNDWKTRSGKKVVNDEVIRYLLALLQLRKDQGSPVTFVHVKGHAGVPGNEGADAQANMGAMLPEVPERDWKAERERVESLISELHDGPEMLDKGVQFAVEDEDADSRELPLDLCVENPDTQQASVKDVSSAAVPSLEKEPPNPSIEDPQSGEQEYSIDDLLDEDDLAAEVEESLKS